MPVAPEGRGLGPRHAVHRDASDACRSRGSYRFEASRPAALSLSLG